MIYNFKIVKQRGKSSVGEKRIYFEFQFENNEKYYISHCDVSNDNKTYTFPWSYGDSTEKAYEGTLKLEESKALKEKFLNDPKIRLRCLLNTPEKIRIWDRNSRLYMDL